MISFYMKMNNVYEMSLSRHYETSHVGDDPGVADKTNIHNLHNRDHMNVERS